MGLECKRHNEGRKCPPLFGETVESNIIATIVIILLMWFALN